MWNLVWWCYERAAIHKGILQQHARPRDPHAGDVDGRRVNSLCDPRAGLLHARSQDGEHDHGFDVSCNSLGFDLRFRV